MDVRLAQRILDLVRTYPEVARFRLVEQTKAAQGRCLGELKIASDTDEYRFWFGDWRDKGDYYICVYEGNRVVCEIREVDGDHFTWKYQPKGRDGQNEARSRRFQAIAKARKLLREDNTAEVPIPHGKNGSQSFLESVFSLLEARRFANDLEMDEQPMEPGPTQVRPLNTILYGPPGTGKTFETVSRCVQICDGNKPPEGEVRARYDDLVRDGRVVFLTFHQSYGYEEFVEGTRPVAQDGHVRFEKEDGVLKRLARTARDADRPTQGGTGRLSFADAWSELQKAPPRRVATKVSKTPYEFRIDGDRIVLQPPDTPQSDDHYYEKATVEELWHLLPKLGDPDMVSPTSITANMNKSNGSYLWIIYKELAKLWAPTASRETKRNAHVLVIDEINRANISKVMGELITLLEEDKRAGQANEVTVTLPYSGEQFTLPSNLHILGTMNTADRSIALLDTALRRRFHFEEMPPKPETLKIVEGVDLQRVLHAVNDRLEYLIDRDHLIGHAWLMGAESRREIDSIFRHKIVPLIAEYFYDDWNRVRAVLGGGGHFIARERLDVPPGLGDEVSESRYRWRIREQFPDDAYEHLIHGADASE